MEAKKLFIKRNVDGKAQVFPIGGTPAVVGAFTYTAKRMGGAPTVTATIYYPTPLDKEWTHEEYIELMGEKYYVTSIPSSSKDNQSSLYKHDVTFTSRREVLDNTLFFDVVSGNDDDTKGGDKYRSNQTKFTFGGDITEFVSRINSSMKYCGVPYSVVIDEGYATSDVKEVSFEDQYVTEVLQLINTTYELSYYWVGNVCHVGKVQNDLTGEPIEYGRNNALVSVSKENSNAKIIDMITGYGSSDNIPYYYPNEDEFGAAVFEAKNIGKDKVSIALSKYWGAVGTEYGKELTLYKGKDGGEYKGEVPLSDAKRYTSGHSFDVTVDTQCVLSVGYELRILAKKGMKLDLTSAGVKYAYNDWANKYHAGLVYDSKEVVRDFYLKDNVNQSQEDISISKGQAVGTTSTYEFKEDGDYTLRLDFSYSYKSKSWKDAQGVYNHANGDYFDMSVLGSIKFSYNPTSKYIWVYDGEKSASYEKCGIEIDGLSSATAISFDYSFAKDGNGAYAFDKILGDATGDAVTVTVTGRTWILPSQNLMPSIYRESGGAERFYYAKDNAYTIPGTTSKYTFKNIYSQDSPHQGSVEFSDIKPTINGIRNDVIQEDGLGQLFGEIADVVFDSKDSDLKDSDSNYIHSYFYIKLHKFSGDYGFDLFAHALASESVKLNMIKSNGCPACSFEIGCVWSADKNKCYNLVSTDGNGNLKSVSTDKNDYILDTDSAMADTLNQDTTQKEIWIAVKKEDSTLGIVMPNASGNFKPQKGDLFVLTGINPPKVLVTAAEKRLDEALIKYMNENNEDKFNFTIKFSRIFLQENQAFASKLNENSKVAINYAGEKHNFFVSNYTVKTDTDALAEIEVELTDSLEVSDSELKKTIDAVKGETISQLRGLAGGGGLDANTADRLYLSKTDDDTAQGLITFAKGLVSKAVAKMEQGLETGGAVRSTDYDNASEQGFSIEKTAQGKYQAFLTNLTVWGKAVFNELEIRKLSYAGGNVYLSGAGSKIVKAVPVKKVTDAASEAVTWEACAVDDADCAGWKCYLLADDGTTATMNYWQEGDQARCQTMGEITSAGSYEDVSNRSYWRTIPDGGVSAANEKIYGTRTETYTDADGKEQTRQTQVELYDGQRFAWIVIGKHSTAFDGVTEGDTATAELQDAPRAGDTIVLDGNRHRGADGAFDKTDRQNVIVLETTGDYAPRIACFANVSEYKHTVTRTVDGKDAEVSLSVFETSPKGGTKINSSRFEWTADDGSTVNIINYRGDWSASSTYKRNDQVNHLNAVWVCVANSGVSVTEEPSDGSSYWKKVLTGGKGEKGDKGDPGTPGTDGKDGTDGKTPYLHVAYAKQKDGQVGFSFTPSDNTVYVGTYTDYNEEASTDPTKYEWVMVRGLNGTPGTDGKDGTDGKTPYLHVAYAKQKDGQVGFSFTPSDNTVYVGTYTDYNEEASTDPTKYEWVMVRGLNGTPGTDAVAYGLQVSPYYQALGGSSYAPGLQLGFMKTTGTKVETFTDVRSMGCTVEIYGDEAYYSAASGYVNEGHATFLYSSYPIDGKTLEEASVISVKLYLDGTVVATASLSNGKQGEGALEILCDPETIVIDTDDNGLATGLSTATAQLSCMRDGAAVSGVTYAMGATVNCQGTVTTAGKVTITKVEAQDATVDGETVTVSKTSGTVTVNLTESGATYVKTIPFTVNMARYTGGLKADNKKLQSRYTELTNDGSITDLTEYKSEILQTAREISLKVSEKQVGRRNLLPGSALRKQGDGVYINLYGNTSEGEGIVVNGGIDGVNAVKVTTKSSAQYCGLFWGNRSTSPNIKIKRNTKYTASVWVKHGNAAAQFQIEGVYHATATDTTRIGWVAETTSYPTAKVGEWQLYTATFSTGNDYDYMECNFWAVSSAGTSLWLCRPMLEEGSEYNGWTESEQDYDYVGGNLLDGTGTLTKTGNVEVLDTTAVTQGGMGESASLYKMMHKLAGRVSTKTSLPSSATVGDYYACDDTWRIWKYTGTTASDDEHYNGYTLVNTGDEMLHNDILAFKIDLEDNKDYVVSWYAKGNGDVGCYFAGNGQKVWIEAGDGYTLGDTVTYGENPMYMTSEWKRYWVHVRKTEGTAASLCFRQYRNSDNTASEVYLSRPKLEVGATMTEWTERRSDMVDKQALLATGIDIESRKITLTADNTTFQGNDGKELAVIDQEGLRASKIATTDNGNGHTVISGNSTTWYQKDGVTPGIAVFYDAAGVPHFQFYGTDGKVKYDFGPSGLQSFINTTQKAYSDTAYLRNASGYVGGGSTLNFDWLYVAENQSGDECYIWRKQVPATDDSKAYEIYDGCVFKGHKYSGTDWPSSSYLLPNGWYVKPNAGTLPMKYRPADEEGVLDPTETLYYQTFYYYSSGKVTRTVKAYMKRSTSEQLASMFTYAGSYDEI